MDKAAPGGTQGRWLATIAQLPIDDPAARMRVLRTLESLGAAVMREGAYLLPDTPENRRALDALADYVAKSAGTVQVLQVTAASPAQEQLFERLFDRSARYEDLIKTVTGLHLAFGQSDPAAISRVLQKQRRDFESIAALDFFPTEARARAEKALAETDAEVKKLFASQKPGATPGDALLKRTWATRKPLWADRLACAWLVRRFVDPEAKMLWLEKTQPPPQDAVGFAYEGAHFAASESRVTYEEMLARLDLAKNPALVKIGSIVRYLEVHDSPVPEAAGVQTLLQGAARRATQESELLAEVEKTFDLLYDAYFEPPKR
jgi:hypothetical protein